MCASPLMSTYNRLDIAFQSGDGVWLTDESGNKYLDTISGIGVCSLGHNHPAVTEAIQRQASQLIHTSNLYRISNQEQLATQLTRLAGMDTVFFANSGAEANEAAIKLARQYGHNKGISQPSIIVMDSAFHGRTMATLTATGNRKIQAGFEPLLTGFVRAPYNDIEALQNIANNNANIVAVLVEPIQGEAGVNIPATDYLDQLRTLCDEYGWLLMLDEVQTGNGRTGKYFAYQHSNCIPDVVTTAKGLGNGVPIGACLARGEASKVLQPGDHGSTFGGNALACAASLAVINTIAENRLCDHVTNLGNWILQELKTQLANYPAVNEIRGKGLMIAIELNTPCKELVQDGLKKGLLLNVTADKVIRLLPPLIMNKDEAKLMVSGLVDLIKQHKAT